MRQEIRGEIKQTKLLRHSTLDSVSLLNTHKADRQRLLISTAGTTKNKMEKLITHYVLLIFPIKMKRGL